MDTKRTIEVVIATVVVVVLIITAYIYGTHKKNTRTQPEHFRTTESSVNDPSRVKSTPSSTSAGLPNPASVNCTDKGGTLSIETLGNGSEYGLCNFEDDQSCEEWALYRGECPVGGVKTTGLDNIQQMYCAWLGGHTLAVTNATCTLPNGNTCPVDSLYNGTCN